MEQIPNVNIGPFHAKDVPDNVRGGTVGRREIPVILYESRIKQVHGKPEFQEKYAILVPPKKDLGLVCAGCYDPKMTLWDISKCTSCRTFAKHLDTKEDGSRKTLCKGMFSVGSLEAAMQRAGAAVPAPTVETTGIDLTDIPVPELLQALKGALGLNVEHTDAILEEITDSDLIHALKGRPGGLAGLCLPHMEPAEMIEHFNREDIFKVMDNIDMEDIMTYVTARDPKRFKEKRKHSPSRLLDTASFEQLEAMIRFRVLGTDTTKAEFFATGRKRKRDKPNYLDDPVVTWTDFSKAVDKRYKRL
jgi:hypothetical protein